jgi:hypothetical protein
MPSSAGSTAVGVTMPSCTNQAWEVVVVVSSSRPSSPRNTHASTPRRASTPAMIGAIFASAHPIAWAAGLTGLASGPRTLNVVPMASSRRGTAAWRSAGWNAAAKQKVIPTCSARRATWSGGRSSRMPSASSTSAEPAWLEADRLPCLTTRAPAPAATIAAMVEMFTLIDRSPPVPTTSSDRPGMVSRVATSYIASSRPVTSSIVSPLLRRATAKPAIWAGVAAPASTSPIAQAVWSLVRSRRWTRAPRTSPQLWCTTIRRGWGRWWPAPAGAAAW